MEYGKEKRVRYEKSPLVEVIFQLRFPTILGINSTPPTDFQELIRGRFPFFEEMIEQQNELLFNPYMEFSKTQKISENKNYCFISSDKTEKINLTSSFISFSTHKYTQWENFIENIKFLVPKFEEIYNPSFYTRIGLRYIDIIKRKELNLSDRKWTELIKPHILGMVAFEQEEGVKSYISETEYKTNIEDVLSKSHFELVNINNDSELSLLIDCDYYHLKMTQLSNMLSIAEHLHTASSSFIQNAITDELSVAMQPVEI